MRARQQAGFHVNGPAFDREADRAALIPSVVGKRCVGLAQSLDDNLRIEQAPQIVPRQQHNFTRRRSNGLGHKSLSSAGGPSTILLAFFSAGRPLHWRPPHAANAAGSCKLTRAWLRAPVSPPRTA